MALERDYEVVATLGEGAFGKVYKARQRVSGDTVAVKQIKLGAKSWQDACRSTELQALKALKHPFVVRLRELLRSPDDGSLYYIFEYVNSDLLRFVKEHPHGATETEASNLTHQLLSGLAYMHQLGFFHRDIKPENILLNAQQGTVRIADFGASRSLRARPPFTEYVGTRWYRAPEALLGSRTYSSPVDVWAAGLVFAELLRGSALFPGQSTIDQLHRIFQVFGKPDASPSGDWPELSELLVGMSVRLRVPAGKGCGVERILGMASAPVQAMIVESLLVLNPRRRAGARRCAEHAIFTSCARHPEEVGPSGAEEGEQVTTDCGNLSRPTSMHAHSQVKEDKLSTCEDVCEPVVLTTCTQSYASNEAEQVSANIDVDLDDELDKILGSGRSPANELAKSKVGTFSPLARVVHKEANENAVDDLLTSLSMEMSTRPVAKDLPPATQNAPAKLQRNDEVNEPLAAEPWSDSDAASEHRGKADASNEVVQSLAQEEWSDDEAASGHDAENVGDKVQPSVVVAESWSDTDEECDQSPKQAPPSMAGVESWSDTEEESAHKAKQAQATHIDAVERWSDSEESGEAGDVRACKDETPATHIATTAEQWSDSDAPASEARDDEAEEAVTVVQSVADDPWSDSDEECNHQAKQEAWAEPSNSGGNTKSLEREGEVAESLLRHEEQERDGDGMAPCEEDGRLGGLADSPRDVEVEVESQGLDKDAGGCGSQDEQAGVAMKPGCLQEAWGEEQGSVDGSSSIRWNLRCAPPPVLQSSVKGNDAGSRPKAWATALDCDLQRSEAVRKERRTDIRSEPNASAALDGEELSSPWSTEELKKLRHAVKHVSVASGIANKEALWQEVSLALGGRRAPRECKSQYALEYKAHKAAMRAGAR
mmetsp:Transcript_54454/g.127144  ORF Transcript_54454/g.127144 Transcript_54454/m.127144 type:complete len:884 (+) Transcript_54454:95-2746(+)